MIHSTLYNKNTNEDPKTSTIFEHLLLLPDNIFWSILRKSTRTFKQELPEEIGYLEKFEFWPKWNPNNTSNSTYVEPDLIIRFNKLDIIVEAKFQDGDGQYKEEWEREIQAYKNEYLNDQKDFILLAIGGNSNYKEEIIDSCKILKTNWSDLLDYVIKTKKIYEKDVSTYANASLKRIFDLTLEGFNIMGEYEYKRKADLTVITQIYTLTKMFSEVCNKRETNDYTLEKSSEAAAASHYVYNFKVQFKNFSDETIILGLSMGYVHGELAIEIDSKNAYTEKIVEMIVSDKVLTGKYLDKPYQDWNGKYYIEANQYFLEEFAKAESYDSQLELLQCFVDELIENYIKYL